MLQNTFLHIPRIGEMTERKIWNQEIYTWDAYLKAPDVPIKGRQHDLVINYLHISAEKRGQGEACFFYEQMSPRESWRLFGEYYRDAAYLDIETTGLGAPGDHITTIALYAEGKVRYYIYGHNLDDFPADVAQYKLLVTYNGKCFDIPFIEREFDICLRKPHIDLRYPLRSLGYSGGLKGCEQQMGISRGELEGVDGYFAVLLWNEYRKKGNQKALETLLAYNIQDTVNLERLMYVCYNRKLEGIPFPIDELSYKDPQVRLPFWADPGTVRYIKEKYYSLRSGSAI